MVKFYGVYQSKIIEKGDRDFAYWSYLRLYSDRHIITVSSTGSPQKIIDWFNRNNCDLPHGIYRVNNSRLAFSTISERGTIDYEGTINEDILSLNIFSHINHHRETRLYYFVPLQL